VETAIAKWTIPEPEAVGVNVDAIDPWLEFAGSCVDGEFCVYVWSEW